MTAPSPTKVSSKADEAWRARCVGTNGTAQDLLFSVLQPTPAPGSSTVGGSSAVAPEETNPSTMEGGGVEEVRVFAACSGKDSDEQELKQGDGLHDLTTSDAMADLQVEFSDEAFQKLEQLPVIQLQEEALMVLNPEEVPAGGEEQHTNRGVSSTQDAAVQPEVQPEVAHRSHIFGNSYELDENSARQLLTDSGWNVSQSVRKGGHTQWYYRSPPPKTTLLGSLTSAVAMWKRLVDEDHKRNGGGDEDPYPTVTAFVNSGRKKSTSKKRKRGVSKPKADS